MTRQPLRIVAPVCSASEARQAIASGADELYCGALFHDWAGSFGDSDLLSRRQGRQAHVDSMDELAAIAEVGTRSGVPTALTVNVRYSRGQQAYVLDLIQAWESMGGTAVLVSDLGVLITLKERASRLQRHLSLLAGVFNSAAVGFFSRLGIVRVVLPRELDIAEITALVAESPALEFEAIALYQKCQFIDGMCGFYHGLRLPADVPALFPYEALAGAPLPVTWTPDPDYEGHGCQLECRTAGAPVRHLSRDDFHRPHCAACLLPDLSAAGVGYLKIAGRAYPSAYIARAIEFLKTAAGEAGRPSESFPSRKLLQDLYRQTFGSACSTASCYYTPGSCKDVG